MCTRRSLSMLADAGQTNQRPPEKPGPTFPGRDSPPVHAGGFFHWGAAGFRACEFVRSKLLLNHADSRFLRLWICCGLSVDNFALRSS
jgi:hypothetical protein